MTPIAALSQPPPRLWPKPLPKLLPEGSPPPAWGFPLADTLILGYGNSRRGDDGLGPSVAAGIDRLQWLGVKVATYPQLTPELAAELVGVRRAIFVDAFIEGGIDRDIQPRLETREIDLPSQALPLVWPRREQLVLVRRLRPEGVGSAGGVNNDRQTCSPAALVGLAQTLYRARLQAWRVVVLGVNFEQGDRLSPLARLGRNRAIATIKRLLRTDGF